jgi:Holliday junction resolvasome RuvABC endonuclease subunit
MILSIDPSSSKTGYAAFDDVKHIAECGVLVADRADSSRERRRSMVKRVVELCDEFDPDAVVIEVPDGKVHAWGQKHNMGVLSIYGMAVGAIVQAVDDWFEQRDMGDRGVVEAKVNAWTGGSKKSHRAVAARSLFPDHYDPDKDAGGDIADAVMLGVWYLDESVMREAVGIARLQTGKTFNRRAVRGPLFGGKANA